MKGQFSRSQPGHGCGFVAASQKAIVLILAIAALLLTCGCGTILQSTHTSTKTAWKSYAEAKASFDRIIPSKTRSEDLWALGFDPLSSNVKVLTYLDVMQRFLPTPAITMADLDPNVRECIEARDGCRAVELDLTEIRGQHTGNVFLDVFGFRRVNHETGWSFKALLLIRNDVVVYKLSSGQQIIDRKEKTVKPLGPFQELDTFVSRGVPSVH